MRVVLRGVLPLVVALALAACGESDPPAGQPLAPSGELAVLAHPGDDLLFLAPAIDDAVAARAGLTVVYVTTGDDDGDHDPLADLDARAAGVRAAYAALAGASASDWSCGWISIAGHAAEHCRLAAAELSLVLLGYPDGHHDGAATGSLLQLWEDHVTRVTTEGARTAVYDRPGLIATLAAVIDATAPATLRTLEVAATHGADHSDHMMVGALAVLAAAAAQSSPQLIAYRGDNIASEPANAAPGTLPRSLDALARYTACTRGCAPCGDACAADQLDATQRAWIARSYPIEIRTSGDGQLRLADRCVVAPASAGVNPVLTSCAGATTWQLGDDGTLVADTGLCLDVLVLTGEVVTSACDATGVGGRLFFDAEGHVWSGVPPAPASDMALAHLYCLRDAGGRPRAGLCGAASAPVWQLAAP